MIQPPFVILSLVNTHAHTQSHSFTHSHTLFCGPDTSQEQAETGLKAIAIFP